VSPGGPKPAREPSRGGGPAETSIAPSRSSVDAPAFDLERRLRIELAGCYRIFDHLGWSQVIMNHIIRRTRITMRDIRPRGSAALRVAARGCDGPVVAVLADSWDRYLSRTWLQAGEGA
jgi:hypothetical protein